MRHVPAAVKLTTPPLSEQPEEEPASVMSTLKEEVALAVGV